MNHWVVTTAKHPTVIKHISSKHLKVGVYKSHIKSSVNFSIAFDLFLERSKKHNIFPFQSMTFITLYKLSVSDQTSTADTVEKKSIAFLMALTKAVGILYI